MSAVVTSPAVALRLGSVAGLDDQAAPSFPEIRAPAFLLEAAPNVAKDGILICALEGRAEAPRLVAIYEDQGRVYDCERAEWADACRFHCADDVTVFEGVGLRQPDRLGFALGAGERGYVLLKRLSAQGYVVRARDEGWERAGFQEQSVLIATRTWLRLAVAPLGPRSRLSLLAG